MQVHDDESLPRDLAGVGRWFWLTILLGGAIRPFGFPVLLPVLGVLLLQALHRLGRPSRSGVLRPDLARPAAAVILVELAVFGSALPLLPTTASRTIAAIGALATLAGVGFYVRALGDFVRRAGQDDGRSIDRRARQWWASAAAVTACILASGALDAVGLRLGLLGVGTIALGHGLFRVGQAQWEVLTLVDRKRQRRSDNLGIWATGRPI